MSDRARQNESHHLPSELVVLATVFIISICLVNVLAFRSELAALAGNIASDVTLFGIIVCLGLVSFGVYVILHMKMSADMRTYREKLEISRRYEKQFREAIESAPIGMALISRDLRFDHVNRILCEMAGCGENDLVGRSLDDICKVSGLQVPWSQIERLQEGEISQFTLEQRVWAAGGRKIDVRVCVAAVHDDVGQVARYVVQTEDVTERKEAEKQIRYLSFHDKLTGLYNRAYFEEELARLDTDRQLPVSIVMGDVNGLKLVNDAFGHDLGDRMLVSIGEILKQACRSEDIVARWGGDEFVILLPGTDDHQAVQIGERIREACAQAPPDPVQPSISLGVSTKRSADQDIRDMLKEAEDRMYRNKLTESSSNRHSVISSLERSLWETDSETEEHVRRVQQLSVRLGKELKLPHNVLDNLSLLAALHDIGKIAISRGLLSKVGELEEDEWAELKRHPEIGYRIALSSPDLAPIGEAVLSHHERWDGKGYPRGLAGESIPIEARVVSVVDAFDVMTHGRPYKEAVGAAEALDELQRCAGTQFDPTVVHAFTRMIQEGMGGDDAYARSPR